MTEARDDGLSADTQRRRDQFGADSGAGLFNLFAGLGRAIVVLLMAALVAVIVVLLAVAAVVVPHDGDAGAWVAIVTVVVGVAGYALATWFLIRVTNRATSTQLTLTAIGALVLLTAALAVQCGLVIFAGRSSWDVRSSDGCVTTATGAIDLATCNPVSHAETAALVVWSIVDAAPLADATDLLKWEVPAVYGSTWVGVLLIYARTLFLLPLIAFVKILWNLTTGRRSTRTGRMAPSPPPSDPMH